MKARVLLGLFALSVAIVFAVHGSYLHWGWDNYNGVSDDGKFLGALSGLNWTETRHFLTPDWGWSYRPVFLFHFWGLLQLFGPNPVPFHAANLLLHAGVVALFGLLVWRLSRDAWISVGAAALFLAYPAKWHAVSWISAASVLYVGLFGLLCLHCWLSYLRHDNPLWHMGALQCFVLALLSKEDALFLVVALPIFALYVKPKELSLVRVREATPFLMMLLFYLCLSWQAVSYAAQNPRFDWTTNTYKGNASPTSVFLQFFSRAILQPLDLAFFATGGECGQAACSVFDFWYALPPLGLVVMCAVFYNAVGYLSHRKGGLTRLAFWWTLGATAPMSLLVGDYVLSSEWMRFYYVPALPVCLMWAVFIQSLTLRVRVQVRRSDHPLSLLPAQVPNQQGAASQPHSAP